MTAGADWRVIESRLEYETGWFDGGYDLVEQPDGTTKRYYWAELAPAVTVVPLLDEAVVFVEQYRPAVRCDCLELPAGIVEDGESFEEAAVRELREETGYRAGRAVHLQTFWVATGVLRHRRGIVVATDLRDGEPARDGNEFLRVCTRPTERALEAARAEPANDAAIEGILLAQADGWLAG